MATVTLEFDFESEAILKNFSPDDIVEHYGERALLEAMDEKEILAFMRELNYFVLDDKAVELKVEMSATQRLK
jgi:hypothetical protein